MWISIWRSVCSCRHVTACGDLVPYPPADVGAPKQGAAPQRGDYATGVRLAGRPRAATPEHRAHQAKGAGLRRRAVAPRRLAEGRQLRLELQMRSSVICRRSGGTGSGGSPTSAGGNISSAVRTLRKVVAACGYKLVCTPVCTLTSTKIAGILSPCFPFQRRARPEYFFMGITHLSILNRKTGSF